MAATSMSPNILIVAQRGRLTYEAIMFLASLRHNDPDFKGRVFVAEPQPNALWEFDPRIVSDDALSAIDRLGGEILPFENKVFGGKYPYGNKIEALAALPPNEPFIFFDTDTLITGPLSQLSLDFSKPSASSNVEGTWPTLELYGPGYREIWKSLYDKFGLKFETSLDVNHRADHWRHYLYFNAGFFYYECPKKFGARFLSYATSIANEPPKELALQSFDPWLDQVALPLVIHSLGGGRNGAPENTLDGAMSCHYRSFSLLFAKGSDHAIETAREIIKPNWIKKVVKEYEPIQKTVLQNKGDKILEMFDRDNLPSREKMIRNRLRKSGLWYR